MTITKERGKRSRKCVPPNEVENNDKEMEMMQDIHWWNRELKPDNRIESDVMR